MKNKSIWLAMTMVLMLVLGSVSFAQGGRGGQRGPGFRGPGMGAGPARQMMRVLRQLDLTEQQKEAVRETLSAQREEMKALHQQLRENREALRNASDDSEISRLAAIQGDLVGKMTEAGALVRLEIEQNILTQEQRDKLQELRAQRQERREKRKPRPEN